MTFVNPIQIKKVSYAYYYGKVKGLNISFVKLGEEECENATPMTATWKKAIR